MNEVMGEGLVKQLRQIRQDKQISQDAVNCILGNNSNGYVSILETRRRDPKLTTLCKWADALGYEVVLRPKPAEEFPNINVPTRKSCKLPNELRLRHQLKFLKQLKRAGGMEKGDIFRRNTNADDKLARRFCRDQGWAFFKDNYWHITDKGRKAIEVANSIES